MGVRHLGNIIWLEIEDVSYKREKGLQLYFLMKIGVNWIVGTCPKSLDSTR
jgi:hypothetical protein